MSKSSKSSKKAQSTQKRTKAATAKKAPKAVSAKADTKKVASKTDAQKTVAQPKTPTKPSAKAEVATKIGKGAPPTPTVMKETVAPPVPKDTPSSANSRARALVLDESDPKKAIAALQKFGSTQLQRVFGDLFGAETTSRNVMYLRSAISKGLLDRAAGTPLAAPAEEKKAARNKVVTEAKPKEPRARDPRLPAVGTTIERLYKGEALRVKVLDEGFLFKGTNYPSLSALAKSLTGCSTNGFLFFQLIERPAKA